MCETTYKPDTPVGEQLEQLLHNVSTWRDALDIINAQIGSETLTERAAKSELLKASASLRFAHEEVIGALQRFFAAERASRL